MKKLRITVEGRAFDVTVEVLEDDGAVADKLPIASKSPQGLAAPPTPVALPQAKSTPPATTEHPRLTPSSGRDVLSQVSGVIVSVDVLAGDTVGPGQPLITIEAMKMNTYVTVDVPCKVTEVLAVKGKSVLAGDILLRVS